MAGEYRQAIDLYTRSIDAFPTAEAYTFRGWTCSFLGDYDRAIAECLQAIEVDAISECGCAGGAAPAECGGN